MNVCFLIFQTLQKNIHFKNIVWSVYSYYQNINIAFSIENFRLIIYKEYLINKIYNKIVISHKMKLL